jgi:DNA replication licensing factor MCM5
VEGEIGIAMMKKYISYARAKCAPRLSSEAAEVLRNHYVSIRDGQRQRNGAGGASGNGSTVPITVRQLEAVIRISESLAKMTLSHQVS